MAKENGCKAFGEDVFGDPLLLKHMNNDALISYFNKAMNEMRIFKLKRQLLRNEGPNPWHL
jgi:hypothetical protein